MKPRVLIIGGVGAGKTTLKLRITGASDQAPKTQVLTYTDAFIDCPGEYLEIPRYYHVIIDASHQVSEIWALQDARASRTVYPPGFAKVFTKPVVGIVTKIDLPDADIERAVAFLKEAGIEGPFYLTSAVTGEGYDGLRDRLRALMYGEGNKPFG